MATPPKVGVSYPVSLGSSVLDGSVPDHHTLLYQFKPNSKPLRRSQGTLYIKKKEGPSRVHIEYPNPGNRKPYCIGKGVITKSNPLECVLIFDGSKFRLEQVSTYIKDIRLENSETLTDFNSVLNQSVSSLDTPSHPNQPYSSRTEKSKPIRGLKSTSVPISRSMPEKTPVSSVAHKSPATGSSMAQKSPAMSSSMAQKSPATGSSMAQKTPARSSSMTQKSPAMSGMAQKSPASSIQKKKDLTPQPMDLSDSDSDLGSDSDSDSDDLLGDLIRKENGESSQPLPPMAQPVSIEQAPSDQSESESESGETSSDDSESESEDSESDSD